MKKSIILIITLLLSKIIIAQSPLWLRYPVISPNGKEIAFCYKGQIYKVSSKGGTATPIVNNKFYNKAPQWSPDGKTIAYASSKYGNFDIFTVSANGQNEKRLTFYSGDEIPTSITPDNKKVLFSASIMDNYLNGQFPGKRYTELYEVPLKGGKVTQVLSIPAEHARYNKSQTLLLFQDYKGYEDTWRKHHTSEVARDIWIKDNNNKFKQLSTAKCENRNAVFSPDEKDIFFLSEQSGSFNVFKLSLGKNSKIKQISFHEKHPVRFLSISNTGTLCYAYNGKIYTQSISGKKPTELKITITTKDNASNEVQAKTNKKASEMAVSPNGKEIAIVYRGEIFVTDINSKTTKQITHSAEQERSISYSPDGKSILYAGEKNGSWNVYTSTIQDKGVNSFIEAKNIAEQAVVDTEKDEFQPRYSPDGEEVAYLEERTSIKIKNPGNNQSRLVYDGSKDYSYADGDQKYEWSPNGKWLLQSSENNLFLSDIYLVNAEKMQSPIDLTQSGYNDTKPKWGMNGEMIIWTSDKYSMRKHAVWWGARTNVFAMFFNKKAYDVFTLSKKDYDKALINQKTYEYNEQNLDYSNRKNQTLKLTDEDHVITDLYITRNGKKLFYLVSKRKQHELWLTDLRSHTDSCIVRFPNSGNKSALWKNKGDNTSLHADKIDNNIFAFIKGRIYKINMENYKCQPVDYEIDMKVDAAKERAYIFEHAWHQVDRKFYRKDLHNVDWKFYKSEYSKFLPHINNNFDFAEMLSEMLGELNASHTGCRYYHKAKNADTTARLGLFLDYSYPNDGVKVDEVLVGGPFDKADSKVKQGTIILSIDGEKLGKNHNEFEFLNKKADKYIYVELYDENTEQTWTEQIKPISIAQERELLYKRWIKIKRDITEKKSAGKIGYVHVRDMDDASLRETYADVLGLNKNKQAIVIDTRHNGGGWLHDNLVDLFNGNVYLNFKIRDVAFGNEPMNKWSKKSILLMSEDNYSDANGFPYAYKTVKLGKIVGKPVAGTMTAVWWERQMNGDFVFGIPQVGTLTLEGKYTENLQLHPDYDISNDYDEVLQGVDTQLETAIEKLKKD